MADGPQVGEDRQEQRLLQELGAERAARALLAADGALHNLDVAIAPFLQPLVKIDHQLEEDAQVLPLTVKVQQRFQVRFSLVRDDAMNAKEFMKRIVDRGPFEAELEALDGL